MSHRTALALVAAAAATLSSLAVARAGTALVVDFTGTPSPPLAQVPHQLSDDMAQVIRQQGEQVNQAPRDDVLALAGCPDTTDDCMQQALGLLQVDRIVLGTVADDPAGGGVTVQLRVIATGKQPRSATLTLHGAAPADLDPAFNSGAQAFLAGQPLPPEAGGAPPAPPPPPAPVITAPAPTHRTFAVSRVKRYSWVVAASGAGALVLGGVLLWAGHSKQQQVDSAPVDTVADLNRLKSLEDSGRRYDQWGSTLAVVGGVAAVVGGVLILKQGLKAEREQRPAAPAPTTVTLAPALSPDSVGISLIVRGTP